MDLIDQLRARIAGNPFIQRNKRLLAAALVGGVAIIEAFSTFSGTNTAAPLVFSAAIALVVYIDDEKYWLSLAVALTAAVLQLAGMVPFVTAELAVAVILYRMARQRSSRFATWAGLVMTVPATWLVLIIMNALGHPVYGLYRPNLFAGIMVMAVFGGAWFWGYSSRLKEIAEESQSAQELAEQERDLAEEERATAEEVAQLREAQAALARDVHDVVGHSLAVILAQAESAEYLPDDDIPALRSAIAAISTSARSALGEVRMVLSATQAAAEMPAGDIFDLIESTRQSGCDVVLEEVGEPTGTTADEAAVAYRVLQELLTNAIKHGTRDEPIRVVREWLPGILRIEVVNRVSVEDPVENREGSGLTGIRQRLTRTGGGLNVAHRDDFGGSRFIARASIVLAGGSAGA